VVADLPVILGDIKIQPRVWIDQIDLGKLGLKLDRLAQVVLGPAVVSEYQLGPE
jgi:hypothetical protein